MLEGDLVVYCYNPSLQAVANGLTLNKVYKIEDVGGFYIIVINDEGILEAYTPSRFIALEKHRRNIIDEILK